MHVHNEDIFMSLKRIIFLNIKCHVADLSLASNPLYQPKSLCNNDKSFSPGLLIHNRHKVLFQQNERLQNKEKCGETALKCRPWVLLVSPSQTDTQSWYIWILCCSVPLIRCLQVLYYRSITSTSFWIRTQTLYTTNLKQSEDLLKCWDMA